MEGTRLQHSAQGTYPCVTLVGRVFWEGSEGEGQGRGGGERDRREGLEGGGEKGGVEGRGGERGEEGRGEKEQGGGEKGGVEGRGGEREEGRGEKEQRGDRRGALQYAHSGTQSPHYTHNRFPQHPPTICHSCSPVKVPLNLIKCQGVPLD